VGCLHRARHYASEVIEGSVIINELRSAIQWVTGHRSLVCHESTGWCSLVPGRLQKLIVYWLAAIIAVVVAFPADSDSPSLRHRYFLVVWGYQGAGNLPRESHSFLTVYRGDDLAKGRVAPATISWFPADRGVRLVGTERGRNFSLPQTLADCVPGGRQVATWGPYEISPALYQRVLARINLLESGYYEPALSSLNVLGTSRQSSHSSSPKSVFQRRRTHKPNRCANGALE